MQWMRRDGCRKGIRDRVHVCPCGVTLGRDHNAALNVLRLGWSRVEVATAADETEKGARLLTTEAGRATPAHPLPGSPEGDNVKLRDDASLRNTIYCELARYAKNSTLASEVSAARGRHPRRRGARHRPSHPCCTARGCSARRIGSWLPTIYRPQPRPRDRTRSRGEVAAMSACVWCKLPEPSMDVHTACCHRPAAAPASHARTGRVWAYLSPRLPLLEPRGRHLEILGIRTGAGTPRGDE